MAHKLRPVVIGGSPHASFSSSLSLCLPPDAEAIPAFVRLLSLYDTQVVEQAVWGLGNIAGDGPECRDVVLAAGALQPIVNILNSSHSASLVCFFALLMAVCVVAAHSPSLLCPIASPVGHAMWRNAREVKLANGHR